MALDPYKLSTTELNGCEGCQHCLFAGIRWPASPDGWEDLSYVDRCDLCELYESDEAAAKALADHFGVRWGYANRVADPKTEADYRWAPADDDGLDYTDWSCFIDHEARDSSDDQGPWIRTGAANSLSLHLTPGAARVLIHALTEAGIGIASERTAGEMDALVLGHGLETLRGEIQEKLNYIPVHGGPAAESNE